jgi:flagellar biosynthesis activator protein FlaF
MLNNSLNTYKKIGKLTETPRETEARVLTQGAVKLRQCLDNFEEGMSVKLYEALIYNRKIWSIFQSDLSKESNPQPHEIKKNLLTLSNFIHSQIRSAMIDPSPEILNSIININITLAKGLGMPTGAQLS